MQEQEKAIISKKFIEALLQVPVVLCSADIEQIEAGIKQYLPDFMIRNFPFFISESMVQSFKPDITYHITDFANLHFLLFLYEGGTQTLIAGPYIPQQPDSGYCEKTLQDNGQNLSLLLPFFNYCQTLPIASHSVMINAVRTALKTITLYDEEISHQHYQPQISHSHEISRLSSEGVDEAAMELLEQRYHYEKLLLQEVRQGNRDQALRYYRQFAMLSNSIVRTEDPVRTTKNLSFSLNTMLRKSAELAGIHPIYLDIISRNFAMLIENSNQQTELEEFKYQMISTYCRFVQKQRLDQYSPMIRKAITYIHIHLGEHLTLKSIAAGVKVSPSYLSRSFNEEVSDSISNYITRIRVNKAEELLSFSPMTIQNISAYVGFNDLNYFSRCFKKYKGMTPTDCRTKSSSILPTSI